ncbi:MAG: cyclic pyranopterin monophosphate synthase MoaC [Desulfotignum sp.]|nr:cyclic pyranopterin monophosphate synthase MoaC [Desulfotignum sp.]
MTEFTHLDNRGRVRMVDVGDKNETRRTAVAEGIVVMQPDTLARIMDEKVKKGNVLETARIAGIMAAKKTAELVPMCHPLNITHAGVDFFFKPDTHSIRIQATVSLTGRTGVEMEALTAVSVAGLTIYDMCKSYDKAMVISMVRLISKSGGKSGTWQAEEIPDTQTSPV